MRILKNIKKNIDDNRFKIFNLVFLSSLIIGIIFATHSIQISRNNLMTKFPTLISLQMSREEIFYKLDIDINWELPPEAIFLTSEIAKKIEAIPYVRNAEIAIDLYLMSTDLTPYFDVNSPFVDYYYSFWENERNNNVYFSFNTRGILNSYPIAFATGLLDLVEGRFFKENDINTIIISQELADNNNLSTGSRIILENIGQNIRLQSEVEVIGIFKVEEDISSNDSYYNYNRTEQLLNQIYIPYSLAEQFNLAYYQSEDWIKNVELLNEQGVETSLANLLSLSAVYYLYDTEYLEYFRVKVQKILPNYWEFIDYSFNFDEILVAFESLIKIFNFILVIALICFFLLSLKILCDFLKKNKVEIEKEIIISKNIKNLITRLLKRNLFISFLVVSVSILSGKLFAEVIPRLALRSKLTRDDNIFFTRICIGCPADAMRLHDLGAMELENQIGAYETLFDLKIIVTIYITGFSIAFILLLLKIINFTILKRKL